MIENDSRQQSAGASMEPQNRTKLDMYAVTLDKDRDGDGDGKTRTIGSTVPTGHKRTYRSLELISVLGSQQIRTLV